MIKRLFGFLGKVALAAIIITLPYLLAKYPEGVVRLYEALWNFITKSYAALSEIIKGKAIGGIL